MQLLKILLIILIGIILGGCSAPEKLSSEGFERPETGVYGSAVAADKNSDRQVWVYAYRSQQNNFRGPADFAARVDELGKYTLDLLPGPWFLLARAQQSGHLNGRPQAGDGWALFPGNPLILKPGQVQRVDLQLQPASAGMLPRGVALPQQLTGFSGRLLDPDKAPVAGAVALAYADHDYQRRPDYSSAAVAADGRFVLSVPPGHYCLVARQGSRGQPRQGELYGLLGAGTSGCREVIKGEVLEVGDIHLAPYLR